MLKTINNFFGYLFYTVAVSKIFVVFLTLLQLGTNLTAIFNGGNVKSNYFPILTTVLGFAELVLLIGSIVMIIINIKKQPGVITGYLYGLGGILLELIMPSSMGIVILFVQFSMFMKAGSKIRSKNIGYERESKTTKKMIKNTDWFYSNEDVKNRKSEKIEKRKAKIEEELQGWRQLLDSGEIDEETYNQEKQRLIEKEKRNSK